MTAQPIETIRSYHAHIYFDGPEQRRAAEIVRAEICERFLVRIGRWHERPIGPHTRAMFQVAFLPEVFPRFVPWLMINRRSLAVLIHPNTGRPRSDHLANPLWLGEILAIDPRPLPESEDGESTLETEPNTAPTVAP